MRNYYLAQKKIVFRILESCWKLRFGWDKFQDFKKYFNI